MDGTARGRTPELDRLVGRNLRAIRERFGLSQTDVAEGMAAAGFPVWRKATVADVERGARKVSLDELAALADVTETRPAQLLAPDAELSDEASRRAKVLTGKATPRSPEGLEDVAEARSREKLTAFLASELGVEESELKSLSREVYGAPAYVERERRVLEEGDIPPVNRQRQELRARRGHATRAILAELRERQEAARRALEPMLEQQRKAREALEPVRRNLEAAREALLKEAAADDIEGER